MKVGEDHQRHSMYRGHLIVKVTRDNGRVSYDAIGPDGIAVVALGCHSLAVVRAEVTAAVGGY